MKSAEKVSGMDGLMMPLLPLVTPDVAEMVSTTDSSTMSSGNGSGSNLTGLLKPDPSGYLAFVDGKASTSDAVFPLKSVVIVGLYVEVPLNCATYEVINDAFVRHPECTSVKLAEAAGPIYVIRSVAQVLKTWKISHRSFPGHAAVATDERERRRATTAAIAATTSTTTTTNTIAVPTTTTTTTTSFKRPLSTASLKRPLSSTSYDEFERSSGPNSIFSSGYDRPSYSTPPVIKSPRPQGYGKPPCKYGASCYRKNPEHFEQYSHPPVLFHQSHKQRRHSPQRQMQ